FGERWRPRGRARRAAPGGPDPSSLLMTGVFDRENLKRALRQMPSGYQRMLVLHDLFGNQPSKIAAALECSVGSPKSQLRKARERMRAMLGEVTEIVSAALP